MVCTLTRIFGPRHLQLAEDVVQEALVKALELWPHRGVPGNPSAWLIEVARNRALDALRRESSLAAKSGELARLAQGANAAAGDAMDDQLAMIFLCCHPDVPREGRVALTLKTVCGFSTGEIARAFLIQEATAAQRIVRAKRLVRDLRFELPEERRTGGAPRERTRSTLPVVQRRLHAQCGRPRGGGHTAGAPGGRPCDGARAGGRCPAGALPACNRRERPRG